MQVGTMLMHNGRFSIGIRISIWHGLIDDEGGKSKLCINRGASMVGSSTRPCKGLGQGRATDGIGGKSISSPMGCMHQPGMAQNVLTSHWLQVISGSLTLGGGSGGGCRGGQAGLILNAVQLAHWNKTKMQMIDTLEVEDLNMCNWRRAWRWEWWRSHRWKWWIACRMNWWRSCRMDHRMNRRMNWWISCRSNQWRSWM